MQYRTPRLLIDSLVRLKQRGLDGNHWAQMRSLHHQHTIGALALLLVAVFYGAAHLPAVYAHRLPATMGALTEQQPLFTITRLAANNHHICALTKAGGVKCWGDNSQGQLGDGTTSYRSQAVAVDGLAGVVTGVTTGAEHSCAVITGNAIQC